MTVTKQIFCQSLNRPSDSHKATFKIYIFAYFCLSHSYLYESLVQNYFFKLFDDVMPYLDDTWLLTSQQKRVLSENPDFQEVIAPGQAAQLKQDN